MPVTDGTPRRKVTTSHGRYYAERVALARRKKLRRKRKRFEQRPAKKWMRS